jgi:hypothetical protein
MISFALMCNGRWVTRHGIRRAAEMREAARILEELGFSGALSEAIAERHESFARAAAER